MSEKVFEIILTSHCIYLHSWGIDEVKNYKSNLKETIIISFSLALRASILQFKFKN